MKRLKIIGYTLLCLFLLLPSVHVYASDNYDAWKKSALIEPNKGQLVSAGPIEVKWKTLTSTNVKNYIVYLDSEKVEVVSAKNTDVMSTQVYTTGVASHTIRIVAELDSNYRVNSSIRTFYVSKKGIGTDMVKDVKLGNAWYYNWSANPNEGVPSSMEFVPMIWGDFKNAHDPLKTLVKDGYNTVLGYNEPDFEEQSNIDVQTAIKNQHYFTESGMRIGSPATFEWGSRSPWLNTYMDAVGDQVDFVPIHAYIGYVKDYEAAAIEFLNVIEQTYNDYHKPVWITEFAVANWDWDQYNGLNSTANEQVYQFMNLVINGNPAKNIIGLDDMSFVERYAWFPFDATDVAGGASGLYYTKVDCEKNSQLQYGQLTRLGELYRDSGNPLEFKNGYINQSQIPDDVYVKDVSLGSEKVYVQFGTDQVEEVSLGALVDKPKDPQAKGYTFKGWYTDKECKKPYNFLQPVTKSIGLYAKFTKTIVKNKTKTITVQMGSHAYSLNSGQRLDNITPKREGYHFEGWYRDKTGTEAFDFSKPIYNDAVLYAKWTHDETGTNEVTAATNTPLTTQAHKTQNVVNQSQPTFLFVVSFCSVAVVISVLAIILTKKKKH